MQEGLSKIDIIDLMKLSFVDYNESSINKLLAIGELLFAKQYTEIITAGAATKEVYYLLSGRLSVLLENNKNEFQKINEITSGELFGEMAVFTGEARATTIQTIRDSILLKIDSGTFSAFLDQHPRLFKSINSTLIKRLSHANKADNDKKATKNICILPIQVGYPVNAFTQSIRQELIQFGKVHCIDQQKIQDENKRSKSFVYYINTIEKENDFILFEASHDLNADTSTMIAQADIILFVGRQNFSKAKSNAELSVNKGAKKYQLKKQYLVLDARGEDGIQETASCLEDRNIQATLHLQKEEDFGRIARYVAGRANKLVLSGGGARGLAHLGVYKAFLELNIPIDAITGSSIGAIMGAAMATGWDYHKTIQKVYDAFVKEKPLNDYRIPFISLLRGKKLDRSLEQRFEGLHIEDLPIPLKVIAANLLKPATVVLEKGLVWKATRASISLPAILPPMRINDELLIDGGIVDNMPLDTANEMVGGPTIGVDLSSTRNEEETSKIKTAVEQKKKKVPNIYKIIMETMTLASAEKKANNEDQFDVYIRPNVSRFEFLDFTKFYEIIEEGYKASLPILSVWKENNRHLS